ncbi:unnamed protein product, partial [Symbiodinium sp. KB8]
MQHRLTGVLGIGITAVPASLPAAMVQVQHLAVSVVWVLGSAWRTNQFSRRASDFAPDAVCDAATCARRSFVPPSTGLSRLGLNLLGSDAPPQKELEGRWFPSRPKRREAGGPGGESQPPTSRKRPSGASAKGSVFGYDAHSLPGLLCSAGIPSGLLAIAKSTALAPRFLQTYALRALFSLRQMYGKGFGAELSAADPDNTHLMESLLLEYLDFPGQSPDPVPWEDAMDATASEHSPGLPLGSEARDPIVPQATDGVGFRSHAAMGVESQAARAPDVPLDRFPRFVDAELRYLLWTSAPGLCGREVQPSLAGGGSEAAAGSTFAPPSKLLHSVRNRLRRAAWDTEVHCQRHITSMLAVLSMRPSYRVGFVAGGGVPKVMGVLQMWRDKEAAFQRRLKAEVQAHKAKWGGRADEVPLPVEAAQRAGSGQDEKTVLQLMATLVNISVNTDAQALIGQGNVRMLMEMAEPPRDTYVHPALQSLASKALVNLSKASANRTFLYRAEMQHRTRAHRQALAAQALETGVEEDGWASASDSDGARSLGSVEGAPSPPSEPTTQLAAKWKCYGAAFTHEQAAQRLTPAAAGLLFCGPTAAGDPALLRQIEQQGDSGMAVADEEVLTALAYPTLTKPRAVAHAVQQSVLPPQPPRNTTAAYTALRDLCCAAIGAFTPPAAAQGDEWSEVVEEKAGVKPIQQRSLPITDQASAEVHPSATVPAPATHGPARAQAAAADYATRGRQTQRPQSGKSETGHGRRPSPKRRSEGIASRLASMRGLAATYDVESGPSLSARLRKMMVNRKAIVENDSVAFVQRDSSAPPPARPASAPPGDAGGRGFDTLMMRTVRASKRHAGASAPHPRPATAAGWRESSGNISVREYVLQMPRPTRPGWGGALGNMSMQRIVLPHQLHSLGSESSAHLASALSLGREASDLAAATTRTGPDSVFVAPSPKAIRADLLRSARPGSHGRPPSSKPHKADVHAPPRSGIIVSLPSMLAADDASVDSEEEVAALISAAHKQGTEKRQRQGPEPPHITYGSNPVPSVSTPRSRSAPPSAAAGVKRLWGLLSRATTKKAPARGTSYAVQLEADEAANDVEREVGGGPEHHTGSLVDDPEEAALQKYMRMKPGLGLGLGQTVPEMSSALAYFSADCDGTQHPGPQSQRRPAPPGASSPLRASPGHSARRRRPLSAQRHRPSSAGPHRTGRAGEGTSEPQSALASEREFNYAYTSRERWSPMITGAVVRDQLGRELASATTKTFVMAAVERDAQQQGTRQLPRRDSRGGFEYVRVTVDADAAQAPSAQALVSNPITGPTLPPGDASSSTRRSAGGGAGSPQRPGRVLLATVYDNEEVTFFDEATEQGARTAASQRVHSDMLAHVLRLRTEGASTLLAGTVPGGMRENRFSTSPRAAALGATAGTVENAALHAKRSALAKADTDALMRLTQGSSRVTRKYQTSPTPGKAGTDAELAAPAAWHQEHQVTVSLARPGFSQAFTFGKVQPGLTGHPGLDAVVMEGTSTEDEDSKALPGESSKRMGRLFAWKSTGGGVSKGLFPSHTLPDGGAVHWHFSTDMHTALYMDSGPPPAPPLALADIAQRGYPRIPAPIAPCTALNRFLPDGGQGLDDEEADGSQEAAGDFAAVSTTRMAGPLDLARRGGVWGARGWTQGMTPGKRQVQHCRLRLLMDPVPRVEDLPPTGPRVEVVQQKVESVFAGRTATNEHRDYYHRPRVIAKAFEYDWDRVLARGALARFAEVSARRFGSTGTVEEELEVVRGILEQEYEYIADVMEFFCALESAHDTFTMTWHAFSAFLKSTGLMDNTAEEFKVSDLDTIFIQLCVGAKASQGTVAAMKDKELTRWQFLEAIARIAHAKYVRAGLDGGAPSWGAALTRFIQEDMHDQLHPFLEECGDEYRAARIYNLDVNDALTRHLPMLRRLHEMFSDRSIMATEVVDEESGRVAPRILMSTSGWTSMLKAAGLLDDNYTKRDAMLSFVWSRLRVANDWDPTSPASRLAFEDFLEDLADEGVSAPHAYVEKLAAEQRAPRRRPSGQWHAPKTRPLAEKLDALLDLLYHALKRRALASSPRQGSGGGFSPRSTGSPSRRQPTPSEEASAWDVAQRVQRATVDESILPAGAVPQLAQGEAAPSPLVTTARPSVMVEAGSAASAAPTLSRTVRLQEDEHADSVQNPGLARVAFSDAEAAKIQ